MHHLEANTIAVEPVRGLRSAQVKQSVKAFPWMYYQEQQLESDADRILYARNGGEESVITAADSYFVDGYDPQTRTVYEFHGCLRHGCPLCHPTRRNRKHSCYEDGTLNELYHATQAEMNAFRLGGYTVVEYGSASGTVGSKPTRTCTCSSKGLIWCRR